MSKLHSPAEVACESAILRRQPSPSLPRRKLFKSSAEGTMHSQEKLKAAAAQAAIDCCIVDDLVLGVGSGTTIVHAVKILAEKVKREKLKVTCIPTSAQAKQLILQNGLLLSDLEGRSSVDVAIDGADEVDDNLNLIKGGGGCLTREKIIADAASKLIIIADESKKARSLGEKWKKGIPLEVVPMAYQSVRARIENEFGGTVNLRVATSGKAGPIISDNGFYLMDWIFPIPMLQESIESAKVDWARIGERLNNIPGVLENGLFIDMAHSVFIAKQDGTVKQLVRVK